MTGARIKEFILHPVLLSIPLWIIVILFIPPLFSEFRVTKLKETILNDNTYNLYSDLDCDGNSEMISVDLQSVEITKIIVFKDNRIAEQYNLRFQQLLSPPTASISFADYNDDKYLEIYVCTVSKDSIFLNIIDPLKSRKIILADRFIDTRKRSNLSVEYPEISQMVVSKADGQNADLFFDIKSGFNLQPRKLYRYIIDRDTLLRSPEAGFIIDGYVIKDLDNNHLPEFLINTHATGNYDADYPYTDMFSWFTVLDHKLKFMFNPVRIHPFPSSTFTAPVKNDGQIHLAVYQRYDGIENISSSICLYDINGNKLKEMTVDNYDVSDSRIFNCDYNGNQTFFFLRNLDGDVEEYDSQLNIVKKITIPPLAHKNPVITIDADGNGRNEYLFLASDRRSIIFVSENFRTASTWEADIKHDLNDLIVISRFLKKDSKPALYLQASGYGIMLRYQKNILYYFKYPFYVALYLSILAFVILLSHIQSYRLKQRQETEKRIAFLQMKSIKNQIDPHFTLNILNSIGMLYSTTKNKKKANYLFGKYARLIRQTVVSSDQIIIPLADEIDFLRNYLDLEKFRNEDNFNYSVEIEENVNLQLKIPRMLIHTFVENAVKYGVKQREKDGFIKIYIHEKGGNYEIIIEDNGPGINNDIPLGTGRGLQILGEMIELFYRLEKLKITYSLDNISGMNESVAGTRATITIPSQKT